MFNVIAILGGGLIKDDNGWRTANFEESDNFGVLGDSLRVEAANCLYQDNPEILIIASGGKGRFKDNKEAPNLSAVIKKELIDLGVPEKNIIEEPESDSTFEQLVKIKAMGRDLGLKNIGIISNKYHLPRIKEMMETILELEGLKSANLVSAENILLDHDYVRWEKIIQKAYKSEAVKIRLAAENHGIEDLRKGRYKLK